MNINEASALALKHLKAGETCEAKKLYREILAIHPDNSGALHFLGVVSYQEKNYDAAIRYIDMALRIEPSYVEAYNNLGVIYSDLGEYDRAVSCFQKAVSFNPNFLEAYVNLANAFQEKELPDAAIMCYQKALRINPKVAGVNHKLALIYKKKGWFADAVTCCTKELEIDPSNTKIYFTLGAIFLMLGQVEEGILCYRKFLEIGPDTSGIQSLSEIDLKTRKSLDEAVAAHNKANDLSILITVSAFNRKKITKLSLEQIRRYKTPYCRLQVYNDHSTEYGNDFLRAYADEVIQLPDKMGIHKLRMHQFRGFLETDFDLLYLTDNDVIHDPHFIAALETLYETGDRKLPAGIFNSGAHAVKGNILYHGNGILLRRFTSGVSMLYDRKMVEKIVSAEGKASPDHDIMAWDYRAMVYLGLPWITSETSYVEHFGAGGINNRDYETDRALNATKYLRERWDPVLKYLTEDAVSEMPF
jgi:tetratricopeptide (TPR) repeat protein